MATRALTPVAQRQSRGKRVRKKDPGTRAGLATGFTKSGCGSNLAATFDSGAPGSARHPAECDQITQELFLNLIATDRISHYLENDYSDSEIRADLLEALGE